MTERKISYALNKIKACKEQGYALEALIRSYHLNIDLVKFILSGAVKDQSFEDKKVKTVIQILIKEVEENPSLKMIINKRSVKSLRPWLSKTDPFFKSLKLHYPKDVSALQDETEKIFAILKISANKLFAKK